MRAFVTGAAGFIGSHLVDRLVGEGWQVRVLIHRAKMPEHPNIEQVSGDIRNFDLLKNALKDTATLFHLASALGSRQIDKKEFREVNAEGTKVVLEAARAAGVKRIVHFSSAGILGHVKTGSAADEAYPPDPWDIYDRTKLEGERMAVEAAGRGQDVVIIRPGWVYGPGDRRTFKLIRAIHRRRLFLVSGGRALQSPVYIDDLIDGALLCSEKGLPGGIYNLSGAEILTVKRMAETIAEALGKKLPKLSLPAFPLKIAAWGLGGFFSLVRREAPLNPSRLAFFLRSKPLNIQKAVRELGFVPAWKFDRGIAAAIDWYRSQGWLSFPAPNGSASSRDRV